MRLIPILKSMINFRPVCGLLLGLYFYSQLFTNPLFANEVISEFHESEIEHIHIIGQRNHLKSNTLVDNNASYTEFIQHQAIKPTIAQWLSQAPGLSLNGQGGLLQSYNIRGFSKYRIHTAVDGIPIFTDRRAGNSASFLPATLIQGADVQKGPSSTLYGSDALGGVINLHSLNFEQKFLAASAQSNDQQKELTLAYGDADWQSALNYRHANNGKSADDTELNTGFEQLAMLHKIQTQLNGLDLKLTWLPSAGKDIGKSSMTFPTERITQYPDELHSLFMVELTQQQRWYGKLYHHYQNWNSDIIRVNNRRNLTEYQSHTLGGSLLATMQLLEGEARFGIDSINRQGVNIKEKEFNLSNQLQFSTQLLDGQQHNNALFYDIHWQRNNIGIAIGMRYDHIRQRQFINEKTKSDQSLNGSFIVNWRIDAKSSVQAEIASGFRFPTLSELYFEGETPRGTTQGNPDLDPEQSKGIQLSIAHQATANLSFDFSSYYYQMDDYIERYDINDDIRGYRNLTEAHIYGMESTINWTLSALWSHHLSYQWQQGEDEDNQTLTDLQIPTWNLSTLWQKNDLSINHQLIYQTARSEHSSQESARGSLINWNITATYQVSHTMEISFWGNNLLNKNIATTADEDAAFIQGINFGIKLLHQFD